MLPRNSVATMSGTEHVGFLPTTLGRHCSDLAQRAVRCSASRTEGRELHPAKDRFFGGLQHLERRYLLAYLRHSANPIVSGFFSAMWTRSTIEISHSRIFVSD